MSNALGTLLLLVAVVLSVGSVVADRVLAPEAQAAVPVPDEVDVYCASARPGARAVAVPSGARIVSAGPGAEGRPWACYVVGGGGR